MSLVLITRPRPDADDLAAAVADRGWTPVVEPLLEIVWRDGPLPPLEGFQGLLFTSANGVRAFARLSRRRDLPVYVVGDATGRAAKEAGFAQPQVAGGDVESLALLVRQNCVPEAGSFLHIAGTVTAGNLSGQLAERGFVAQRLPLYEARRASRLCEAVQSAWRAGRMRAVLLYSPRTALILGDLLVKAELTDHLARTDVICLSAAVALATQSVGTTALAWRAVRVAPAPQEGEMLQLLDHKSAAP